jgi:hypothetical protein
MSSTITPEGQRGPWWCSMHVKVGACDHNPCLEKKNPHTPLGSNNKCELLKLLKLDSKEVFESGHLSDH